MAELPNMRLRTTPGASLSPRRQDITARPCRPYRKNPVVAVTPAPTAPPWSRHERYRASTALRGLISCPLGTASGADLRRLISTSPMGSALGAKRDCAVGTARE